MAPIAPEMDYPDFSDWYWKAEDGRLYSSKRLSLVEADDPDFLAWSDAGREPRAWPQDAEGQQTQAALDVVLIGRGVMRSVTTRKLDFWRRMTEDEAETAEMALAGAKVRDRRMIEEAQIFDHADEDFHRLREAVVGMFGEPRADELLAPSA